MATTKGKAATKAAGKAAGKAATGKAAHPLAPRILVPAVPVAPAVAVLGRGRAAAALTLGSKPYGVRAPHNVAWWLAINTALAANGGQCTTVALQAAVGCPLNHFGYLVARGHLAIVA